MTRSLLAGPAHAALTRPHPAAGWEAILLGRALVGARSVQPGPGLATWGRAPNGGQRSKDVHTPPPPRARRTVTTSSRARVPRVVRDRNVQRRRPAPRGVWGGGGAGAARDRKWPAYLPLRFNGLPAGRGRGEGTQAALRRGSGQVVPRTPCPPPPPSPAARPRPPSFLPGSAPVRAPLAGRRGEAGGLVLLRGQLLQGAEERALGRREAALRVLTRGPCLSFPSCRPRALGGAAALVRRGKLRHGAAGGPACSCPFPPGRGLPARGAGRGGWCAGAATAGWSTGPRR